MFMTKIGELVDLSVIEVVTDYRMFGEVRGDGYCYRQCRSLDLYSFSEEERRLLLEGREIPAFWDEDTMIFLDEGGLEPDFDEDEDCEDDFDEDEFDE